MEQKLNQAFDALHMDAECSAKIEAAIKTTRHSPARPILRTALAFCFAAVIVIFAHPTIASAVEELAETIKLRLTRKPDAVILRENYAYYNDQVLELELSAEKSTGTWTLQVPECLKVSDGRVYFLGNAESMDIRYFLEQKEQFDITGKFSADEPYICSFEQDGILHYIAIGGDFDPVVGIESIEYAHWLRRADQLNGHIDWLGAAGQISYLDEEGTILPTWYAKAIVELNIPWNYEQAMRQLGETE